MKAVNEPVDCSWIPRLQLAERGVKLWQPDHTGSASSQVLAAATVLSQNSSELSHEVEVFLASVAAA
jgi:hypothetical protein